MKTKARISTFRRAARRAVEIQPFVVMDVLARAARRRDFLVPALEREGVAATPGIDFGANATKRYVRFACTRSMADLEEAAARLKRFCLRNIKPTRRAGTA